MLPLLCFSGQNWGLVCAHRLQHSDVDESRAGSAMGHPPMCTRGTHWGETLVRPKTACILLSPRGGVQVAWRGDTDHHHHSHPVAASAPNLMSSHPFRNRHFSESSGAPLGVLLGCGPAQVDCSSERKSRLQQPLPPCMGLTPVLISVHVLKGQSVPRSILFLMRHLELGVGALKGGKMLRSTSAAPTG